MPAKRKAAPGKAKAAGLKTKATGDSVGAFLAKLDAATRADCERIVAMMRKATGAEPKMWGSAIVGFGERHYVYESGREGDWFVTGFSPRKANLTLYVGGAALDSEVLARLGKHTTGKGCLYLKRLADVDEKVLREIVEASAARTTP